MLIGKMYWRDKKNYYKQTLKITIGRALTPFNKV